MKYIRTKDGIYKVKGINNNIFIIEMNNGYIMNENQKNILSQADTIEELCDEFVIKYFSKIEKKYKYLYLEKYEELKSFNWEKDDDYYIYGAIRIKGEKGEPILKSVAKMNEKGEFELL